MCTVSYKWCVLLLSTMTHIYCFYRSCQCHYEACEHVYIVTMKYRCFVFTIIMCVIIIYIVCYLKRVCLLYDIMWYMCLHITVKECTLLLVHVLENIPCNYYVTFVTHPSLQDSSRWGDSRDTCLLWLSDIRDDSVTHVWWQCCVTNVMCCRHTCSLVWHTCLSLVRSIVTYVCSLVCSVSVTHGHTCVVRRCDTCVVCSFSV